MSEDPYRELGMDPFYQRSKLEEDPEVAAKKIAEMQQTAKWGRSDKEKLASWMIENSFATGHGDTMDDLLKELSWQVKEILERARR